jgi:hypothetical protein
MRPSRFWKSHTRPWALVALCCVVLVAAPAVAQDAAPAAPQFAPGVVTTIEPELDPADALSVHDLVELRANEQLEWQPSKWLKWESATSAPTNRTLYEMSQNAAFPLHVWCLEFAFKPLRMIEVDVPVDGGGAERKQIWYMVYRVRNTGAGITGQIQDDGEFVTVEKAAPAIRFIPQLVLTSQDRPGDASSVRKAYLDRVVPAAMGAIRAREMRDGILLDSVEIAQNELPMESGRTARGVWGVAMWEDVDPELDFFSVYVGGVTNAYRWTDPPGAYAAGDGLGKGRKFARKQLQLNFWRPGDAVNPTEREFRYGVAPGEGSLYEAGEGVAYQWVYR